MQFLATAIIVCLAAMVIMAVFYEMDSGVIYDVPKIRIAFGCIGILALILSAALAVWSLTGA